MARTLLIAVLALTCLPLQSVAQAPDARPVVIVHGAYGGGWDWRTVEAELRDGGHDVYRVTLTGLGERHHLASADIGLDTHVTDVANVIVWERLEDVILLGHSYGGMVITGAAERVPDRIGHLVYVDAFVPYDGECVLGVRRGPDPPDGCDATRASNRELVDGLMVPPWVEDGALPPSDVPHPFKTFTDRLDLRDRPGNGRPATYIITRAAPGQEDGFDWAAGRAADLGWPVLEIISGHNPQRDAPGELAQMLSSLD